MDNTPTTADVPTSATQAILKRLRSRKLSQSEISRLTGISQPQLSRWEAGEVPKGADGALALQKLDEELTAQDKGAMARSILHAPTHVEPHPNNHSDKPTTTKG